MVTLKEIIKPYENPELCAKWENNIPASELEGEEFSLLLNSQDIDDLLAYFPMLEFQNITGALVSIGDGDYGEVYVTESSRPYDLNSIYHPLSYYLED